MKSILLIPLLAISSNNFLTMNNNNIFDIVKDNNRTRITANNTYLNYVSQLQSNSITIFQDFYITFIDEYTYSNSLSGEVIDGKASYNIKIELSVAMSITQNLGTEHENLIDIELYIIRSNNVNNNYFFSILQGASISFNLSALNSTSSRNLQKYNRNINFNIATLSEDEQSIFLEDYDNTTYVDFNQYSSSNNLVEFNYFLSNNNAKNIYNEGYDEGYDDGYETGNENGYNDGYNEGYEDGERDGYENGEEYGYNVGYADGEQDGYNKKYDFLEIIKGAFDAVSNFFNMEIFPGVKFIYIIGIPIVIAVLRFVIGWFR